MWVAYELLASDDPATIDARIGITQSDNNAGNACIKRRCWRAAIWTSVSRINSVGTSTSTGSPAAALLT